MMWNADGMWGFGMGFGWIIPLVLIVLGVWAFRSMGRDRDSESRAESPLDILKARYARGELTKEQYEEMRQDIS